MLASTGKVQAAQVTRWKGQCWLHVLKEEAVHARQSKFLPESAQAGGEQNGVGQKWGQNGADWTWERTELVASAALHPIS